MRPLGVVSNTSPLLSLVERRPLGFGKPQGSVRRVRSFSFVREKSAEEAREHWWEDNQCSQGIQSYQQGH